MGYKQKGEDIREFALREKEKCERALENVKQAIEKKCEPQVVWLECKERLEKITKELDSLLEILNKS